MSAVRADFDDSLNAKLVECFGSPNTVSMQAEIGPQLILTYVLDADPSLGREYRDPVVGVVLFKQYPDLHTTMKEACASGRFGDFRKKFLSITKPNVPEPLGETPLPSVREAFYQTYYGTAVDGFYEYLQDNNRKFHSANTNYYAKFGSIVQSSGTGKSRMMFEATVQHWHQVMNGSGMTDNIAQARKKFFEEVRDEYTKVMTSFSAEKPKATAEVTKGVDEVASKMNQLSVSDSSEATPEPSVPCDNLKSAERQDKDLRDFETVLRHSYRSLLDSFPQLFDEYSDGPKLVIAIDEAHCLSEVVDNTWRPSHILCQTINTYSCVKSRTESVWVVFASTNSKIADYSAPATIHDSLRIAIGGALLFTPYTLLGWDQGAPPFSEVLLTDNTSNSSFEHLVGFGRPLWSSQQQLGYKDLLSLGMQKLLKAASFKPADLDHALAVIGQRFCISLCFGHPESVKYLESGVSSHMLICHATTEDRTWRFTNYPSEPFLSHVAGHILHQYEGNVVTALTCIKEKMDSGMIEIGKTGEFASRLVWLLCKDLLLRKIHKEHLKSPPEVLYCREVSVPQFLEMCFGKSVWPKDQLQREAAQEAFKHAYVNFSHWISMTQDICDKKRKPWCPKTWLLRLWSRTAAAQCCHQQPLIDKVMPICFKQYKGGQFENGKDQMSLIAASDKAGKKPNPSNVNSIARNHDSIRCVTALPWIAVTFDMGVKQSAVHSTFPTRKSIRKRKKAKARAQLGESEAAPKEGLEEKIPDKDLCLRIYASGMNTNTFPFLAECPGLDGIMNGIVQRAIEPLTSLPVGERLRPVMRFGETTAEENLRWEYGKQLPRGPEVEDQHQGQDQQQDQHQDQDQDQDQDQEGQEGEDEDDDDDNEDE
ncbi:hypothetical protein A0H81_05691 [Grifola frondosa]|uniref:Uncharacterized protein n=1 Tax=Grifola frondosa TaxID=5627 RepID=A0A1C7MD51_GRIFR|nr:hypothetical protein A0H81_05691 [Grifola frondosa]